MPRAARTPISKQKIAQDIAAIDWTLSDVSRDPLDSLHPYPAKFIAEIPRRLLEIISPSQYATVFDPFCGSGTSLSVAQQMGYSSVGIDLNPIACLISRVRTGPTLLELSQAARYVVEIASKAKAIPPDDIPNLNHWFKPEIQVAVASLVEVINSSVGSDYYDALRLALSSILVRVSNQESDTRYAAIAKNVSEDDVFIQFVNAAGRIENALAGRKWSTEPISLVVEGDTLSLEPAEIPLPVDVVITSPPYPNAYEYWLYHKYRMWWLGFDPLAVKEKEIGARAHFFKKDAHSAESFILQMDTTLSLIERVLVGGGFACFIIGRSKIHGELVDNGAIIQAAAERHGMTTISVIERSIAQNRKSFNLSHARIKTENILVFQKN